jgi:uncharacterized DUF497 family protein
MKFEWDAGKAELNLKKHKVSFEEASTVFFDPFAKITHDPDHSDDEHRQPSNFDRLQPYKKAFIYCPCLS